VLRALKINFSLVLPYLSSLFFSDKVLEKIISKLWEKSLKNLQGKKS